MIRHDSTIVSFASCVPSTKPTHKTEKQFIAHYLDYSSKRVKLTEQIDLKLHAR